MTDDDDLPRIKLEEEKLRYQWYTGYDEQDEYDKDPEWATEIGTEEVEVEEDEAYSKPEVRFYDRNDPEYAWIRSDTTRDLMRAR